ncbi:hypothetical protein [Embleya sp. NPDC005971]|uniref:hypothetical protein n=1 Tax=Embleya sp. NPDC005971 TaxID=3156724 RepID=UPI003402C6C3
MSVDLSRRGPRLAPPMFADMAAAARDVLTAGTYRPGPGPLRRTLSLRVHSTLTILTLLPDDRSRCVYSDRHIHDALMRLNARRINLPEGPAGERFRELLAAYQATAAARSPR